MATAPESLHMRSTDLIKKEALDYGGFGDVFLCYHKTLGHVVLKTVYTGHLRNDDNKRSLLEEGNIMAKLQHERVVKLLGVIMEDRDCSLVMELIPKGNLWAMLVKVEVPISIKGRIILEILEGMVYLTEKRVIHKDIKPENILVDKDFHIKIADLGLATCQTWSKLTKQESRRKSRLVQSGSARGAGTLSYMAPEHLESIHTVSTEKSDVYSFAIVVWVVLTGKEPYENAKCEDHISQCVRRGDRPHDDFTPADTPQEITQLMKTCWQQDPKQRPTFKEGYDSFQPFYMDKLEPFVEKDALDLRNLYEGPDELVDKLKCLSVTPESLSADCPAPLLSSDSGMSVPVEASIEDFHFRQFEGATEPSIQADAQAGPSPPPLEEKLNRELQYHIHGSYSAEDQRYPTSGSRNRHSNHFPVDLTHLDHNIRQPAEDTPSHASSVQSWKAEAVHPVSQEEARWRPTSGMYESMSTSLPQVSMSVSTSSLPHLVPQHPNSHYERQQSLPVAAKPIDNVAAEHCLAPMKGGSLQDTGGVHIHNASAIQIGHYNTMSIRGVESLDSLSPTLMNNGSASSLLRDAISKYEAYAVTEEHLNLLRENIGSTWKQCARRLHLTDVEIESIEHDNSIYGLQEMVHQMLECWKMKEGSVGCTIGNLCHALEGRIKVEIIRQILCICANNSYD
ncbi:receptor-interacting serine/threonine-protein kinase 1 [Genypterus blacodes]|uniref:receptor-interacting serine/threonine-protein kinase 1 n=1 Tax=Genypterus blacodes TaxID=154954 RepID=UPI003F75BF9C